jgi:serine/threonine protein kinase
LTDSGYDTFASDSGKVKMKYLVMDFIDGKELFDFVEVKPFDEKLARYFFI